MSTRVSACRKDVGRGPAVAILLISLLPLAGCTGGPTEFDYHELTFRDSLRAEAPARRSIVVLEQLGDGPIWQYEDVSHDVTRAGDPSDSLWLFFDVEGVSTSPNPVVFKETKVRGDTLFVWYADDPREYVTAHSGKLAGTKGIRTSPPEEYLKVTHVTIRIDAAKEVEFSHAFVR